MRYLLQILTIGLLVVSCQIEDENAPTPDEAFIKYYGELTTYEASDIEIVYDLTGEIPEGFVVFGTKLTDFGDPDYFILLTDLQGNLIDSVSFGYLNQTGVDFTGDGNPDPLRGFESASQIEVLPNGAFFFVGTSTINGSFGNLEISDWKIISGGFANVDLEITDDSLFTIFAEPSIEDIVINGVFPTGGNINFDRDLIGNDIIFLSDGSVLIVGAKEFDRGGGVSDFDNYFLKLPINTGFEEVQGVAGEDNDDIIRRAFEKPNGNLVLIGDSNVPSARGENGGNNGTNVFYLETDPNGTEFNSAAYGMDNVSNNLEFDEQVNGVIKSSFGYSIVGTSTVQQTNDEFGFLMNLSNNGLYLSANSHDSSEYNSQNRVLETRGRGVVQAADNDLIMLGQYTAFNNGTSSRGGEGMFVKFDQAANPVAGAESFFGLSDGNETIVDAVTLPDGKIVAVANVDFGGGVKLISIIKLNDDGSLD